MSRIAAMTLAVCLLPTAARADEAKPPPPPLDGPAVPFVDSLLDKLVGEWSETGTVMGRPAKQKVTASWVLNHQFLQLQFSATEEPPKGRYRYEALVFIGFDHASERYVVHWIDVFGGRFSETLGYGTRDGDALKLVFEYPDGPFHTTFTWSEKSNTWSVGMRQKDAAGAWTSFAEETLTKAEAKPAKK